MQKKIIALAVAGLMSGAAFAQSNVTISGIVDMGWSHRSDNIVSSVNSKNSIDSGIQSGSRVQFAGVEDLGGGLKAGFVLEQGLFVDTGQARTDGVWSRQSFLYMSGGFGTVAAGRQYTPQFNLLAAVDPFGYGTVGQVNNLYTSTARLDNLVAYVSPSFSGFNVVAGYTAQAGGQEVAKDSGNTRVWAINPNYKNGPILVGFNYHNIRLDTGSFSTKVWDLGGSYDLGMVKLAAVYGRDLDIDAAGHDRKKYMLGLTVPVGAGAVLASYNKAKQDTAGNPNGRQIAVGYQYNMSKRTNLYAVYSDISNKDGATFSVGDSSNGGAGYQQGLNLGVRHKF